jgi:phosphoglycerol transferase
VGAPAVHGAQVEESLHHRSRARTNGWPAARPSSRLADAALATGAACAALAIAIVALRAWRVDLDIPLGYSGDGVQVLGFVQNMVETGWYLDAPRLNSPFGQELHDWPLGVDNMHLALLRILTLVTGQAPATVTLFYLATFPLAALAAYWALRSLHVRGPVAFLGATIFAVLPYHFVRGTGHLFLAAYYSVPVGAYLCIATLEGRAFFGLNAGKSHASRVQRTMAVVVPLGLALMIASGGVYYAVFTIVLLAVATLFAALRRRSKRVLTSGVLLILLVAGFTVLNTTPSVLYQAREGSNADVPSREARESERHALRPVALIMPVVGHRLQPLADLAERYSVFPTPGERGESIGLVGTVGLVGLVLVAFGALTRAYARGHQWMRFRRLSVLTMVLLLVGVTGGASTLVALLVTAQVRAWNRVSLFIAFFALLAVCLVLSRMWRRVRRTQLRPLAVAAIFGILAVAALDQTSDRFIPSYAALREEFLADRAFVHQVEQSLPYGAAVFQLPYRPYPEGGPLEDSVDYDPLRGYLHSRHLHWSYGGMKGREAGWQPYVHGRPVRSTLPLIAVAGFSAVWIDRFAYEDGGAGVEAQLQSLLGTESVIRSSDRWVVLDIRDYAAALRQSLDEKRWTSLREATRSPIWVRWRSGVVRGFPEEGRMVRGATGDVMLGLVNDTLEGRNVTVSLTLATAHGPTSRVAVHWPDGTAETIVTSNDPVPVERTLELQPGENRVHLRTDAPVIAAFGDRDVLRLRISDLWAVDASLLEISPAPAPGSTP